MAPLETVDFCNSLLWGELTTTLPRAHRESGLKSSRPETALRFSRVVGSRLLLLLALLCVGLQECLLDICRD